jgi:hypothetical protein
MVLRMDVPTDWVFMTPQYLNSKGGYHAGEAEPVIIGPLGGYTLTPDRIQHLRHGGRKLFAEETPGTADPNTYFVTFALGDDEEDWKRHQWDESSEEWKAQWQKESPSSSPESKS